MTESTLRGPRAPYFGPPWYGFEADMAIAGIIGYCGTLDTAGKETLDRWCCGTDPLGARCRIEQYW
jgi:hypothetical protein